MRLLLFFFLIMLSVNLFSQAKIEGISDELENLIYEPQVSLDLDTLLFEKNEFMYISRDYGANLIVSIVDYDSLFFKTKIKHNTDSVGVGLLQQESIACADGTVLVMKMKKQKNDDEIRIAAFHKQFAKDRLIVFFQYPTKYEDLLYEQVKKAVTKAYIYR